MTINELNQIFNIPWDSLPVQHPSLKPGFPNTSQSAIKNLVFDRLSAYFPSILETSSLFKDIIKDCIFRAFIIANENNMFSNRPTKLNPVFLNFSIALQSSFYLCSFNPTEEDLLFFSMIKQIQNSQPEYLEYLDLLKNKHTIN